MKFLHSIIILLGYLSLPVLSSSSAGCDDLYTSLLSSAATGVSTVTLTNKDIEHEQHLQSIIRPHFTSICSKSLTSAQATDISRYLRNDQSKTNEILISIIGRLFFRQSDVYSPTSRILSDFTPKINDLRSTLTSILVGNIRITQLDTVLGTLLDNSPTQQHAIHAEKFLDYFNYRVLDATWGSLSMNQEPTISTSTVYNRAKTDVMYSFSIYRGICSSFRSETLESLIKLIQNHALLTKFLQDVVPIMLENIHKELQQQKLLHPALPLSPLADNKPTPPKDNDNIHESRKSTTNERVPTVGEFLKTYKEPTILQSNNNNKEKESKKKEKKNKQTEESNLKNTIPESIPTPKEDTNNIYGTVPKLVKYDLDSEL